MRHRLIWPAACNGYWKNTRTVSGIRGILPREIHAEKDKEGIALERENLLETVAQIGERLNRAGVTWAVGASLLLNRHGLVDQPGDIDLLVALEDGEKAEDLLSQMGTKQAGGKSASYLTACFREFMIHGWEVDMMAGLKIKHAQGIYEYVFDAGSISQWDLLNGIPIPFAALEDWYVLYQLIPGREDKAELIETYLREQGVKQERLYRALAGELPKQVRDRVYRWIG